MDIEHPIESHSAIYNTLNGFIRSKKIPHILFHGGYGTGKKTIANDFIRAVYGQLLSPTSNVSLNEYVMTVECTHGKGIKFVREDIKFFAKTNINCKHGLFKTILLLNADQLTLDAQSALRRCIEIFSTSTRFILIIQNKDNILRPILSRFCDIYVPQQNINGHETNLYNSNIIGKYTGCGVKSNNSFQIFIHKTFTAERTKFKSTGKINVYTIVDKMYNKGISIIDLIHYIKHKKGIVLNNKYDILILLNELRLKMRCERTLLFIACNLIIIRLSINIDNILCM